MKLMGPEGLADNVDDGGDEHGGHSEMRCKLVGEWGGGGERDQHLKLEFDGSVTCSHRDHIRQRPGTKVLVT